MLVDLQVNLTFDCYRYGHNIERCVVIYNATQSLAKCST